jgi:hypothetical protein
MEQKPSHNFSSEGDPGENEENSAEKVLYSKLDDFPSQEDHEFFKSTNRVLESLYEGFKEFQAKNDRDVDIYDPDMIRKLDEYWQSEEVQDALENFLENANIKYGDVTSTIDKESPTETALEFLIQKEIVQSIKEKGLVDSSNEASIIRKVYLPEYGSPGYEVKSYREKLEGLDNLEEGFTTEEQEEIIRRGNIMMALGKVAAGRSDEFKLGFDKDKVEGLIESDVETDEITRQIWGYRTNLQIAIQEGKDEMVDRSAIPKPTLPILKNHLNRVLNNPEEFQRDDWSGYGHLDHGYMYEADLNEKRKRILNALSNRGVSSETLENYAEKIGVNI